MSHHILHIFQHGATIGKERGFLTARTPDAQERRLPIEDIRAVITAARGVTFTSAALSGLLEQDAIILHCNDRYQPCGWTVPINRITDLRAFQTQISNPTRLNARLWHYILYSKTKNQYHVLARCGQRSAYLEHALTQKTINEANCARHYWQLYFPSIGYIGEKRDRKHNTPPNQMLNYGYAVLAALCHRSLIVHGLMPQIGIFHKPRYRSEPLVYDLMEPFRPIVEMLLAEFIRTSEDLSLNAWAKAIAKGLKDYRVTKSTYTLKLLDAIDISASSLARAYATKDAQAFWLPELHHTDPAKNESCPANTDKPNSTGSCEEISRPK